MNVPRSHIEVFAQFLTSAYGCTIRRREVSSTPKPDDEHFRTMKGDRLIMVREMFPEVSENMVEVFCSDKELIRRIEAEFDMVLMKDVGDERALDRRNEVHESGNGGEVPESGDVLGESSSQLGRDVDRKESSQQ